MKILSSILCFTFTLNGYIHDTVTLWDVNNRNEARRITLFGDYHREHEAVAGQYGQVVKSIEERAKQSNNKPLCILLEQPPKPRVLAFDELLSRFSRLNIEKQCIAPGVSLENIEIRAAALAAMSVLMTQNGRNDFEGFELDDRDSTYKPSEITFDDLLRDLEKRKREVVQKSRDLGLESLITPYVEDSKQYTSLLNQDLTKLNIDLFEPIVEIADRLRGDANPSTRDRLCENILHASAIIFDLHAVCRVREIDHNHDVLTITGAAHMPLFSYLLKKTGAWDISPNKDNPNTTISHLVPSSNEQLDILNCQPSYMKYVHMKLYQYTQWAIQCMDA